LGISRRTLFDRLAADPDCPAPWKTIGSLGRVESGALAFPLDKAPAIARALDVPLSDLIGYDHQFVPAEIERANADAVDRAAAIRASNARLAAAHAEETAAPDAASLRATADALTARAQSRDISIT
jgi:hypothetical protein